MANIPYWMVVRTLRGMLGTVCRLETHGTQDVPAGPWILACNHLSHFDPPLVAGAFRRPLDFLAMRELFRPAWFGFLLKKCGVISLGRGQVDTAALKEALTRLKQGRIVSLFPEGGLRAGESSVLQGAPLKEGIFLLATKAGCPVRPAVIVGSDQLYLGRNWWRRPRVVVAVGPPLAAPRRGDKREVWVKKLAEAMRLLYEEAKVRHALEPEVLPKTAQERWAAGR